MFSDNRCELLDSNFCNAPEPEPVVAVRRAEPIRPTVGGHYRASEVLDAILDKRSLAAIWGLRLTGRWAGPGALECHAIDPPDADPSAIFKPATGQYWSPWLPGGRAIDLFSLAVGLGIYLDWRDALADLGHRYSVRTLELAS